MSTNFLEGYDDVTVTVVLPNDNTKSKVKKAIQSSLDYAVQKNPSIDYPTFKFKSHYEINNAFRYIGPIVLVLIIISLLYCLTRKGKKKIKL